MLFYTIKRLLYGILILIGVNLLTFALFFAVNTTDDMARLAIGGRYVTTVEDTFGPGTVGGDGVVIVRYRRKPSGMVLIFR